MKKGSVREKQNSVIENIREHKWTAAAYFILKDRSCYNLGCPVFERQF